MNTAEYGDRYSQKGRNKMGNSVKNSGAKLKFPIFTRGDFNGVIYVFVGNIGSFLVAIASLKGFGWSDELIFDRVIPGICLGLLFSGLYYTFMAIRLGRKEGRTDVTALPFGLSTPVMMVYLFSVIAPLQFGLGLSPEETWKYTLAAVFVGGLIESCGGFVGPIVRKLIPRAAMLATVGGIALVWMGTRGVFSVYALPLVGMPVLMVALLGLIGGYKLPKRIPPLVVALVMGIVFALVFKEATIVLDKLGTFTPAIPAIGTMIEGFKGILPVLVTIIPVEIYNFIETMDNVESAIVAGDNYNVKEAQIIDGVATALGACFGAVLPNTVWIGHPGLKKSGCGIGFAWVSGLLFAIAGFFGFFNFLYYLIPGVVVAIVFLWCTQLIVTQSFVDNPRRYGAAIVIGLIPHIADLLHTQTTAVFSALGSEMTTENIAAMVNGGAYWYGVPELKAGAIITGMLWAAVVCFIIDRNLVKATIACLVGAVMTFFGIIHGSSLGINVGDPKLLCGYLMAAAVAIIFHLVRRKLEYERRYDYL